MEDRILIWKLKRGSKAALSRIYEKYRDCLLRIAFGLANQPKDSPTWRVIYGDLSVKDVNEEDLPN